MKISLPEPARRQDGMAVIAIITILSIILIFVASNLRTLYLLRSDLRFIEQQQTNRLAIAGTITNLPSNSVGQAASRVDGESPKP